MTESSARFSDATLGAALAGLVGTLVLVGCGFGQLDPDVASWMQRGADRGLTLTPWLRAESLTVPSPGFEVLAAGTDVIAGSKALTIHYAVSIVAGVVTCAACGWLAARLAGSWLGGLASALLFLGVPDLLTVFTSPGPAAIAVACSAVVAFGLSLREAGAPAQIVTLVVGALWVLIWPPAIGVLAAGWGWLIWRRSDAPDESDHRGMILRPRLPLGLAVAPVAVVALVSIYPAFWPHPIDRWGAFLFQLVDAGHEPLLYAATIFEQSRPPVWFGGRLAAESLPLVTVAFGLAGAVMSLARDRHRRSPERAEVASLTVSFACLALLFPWLSRSMSVAGTPHLVFVAVPLVVLGGSVAARVASDLTAALDGWSHAARTRFALVTVGVVCLPGALNVIAVHPLADCWWNSTVGGVQGAAQTGRPVCRIGGLPWELVDDPPVTSLYGGDAHPALESYDRAGWLDESVGLPNSGAGAEGVIRRAETMRPGTDAVGDDPDALAPPKKDRLRELRFDDLSVWRIDAVAQQIPSSRNASTSADE